MLIPKMNYEHGLKVGFEGIKFGSGKYREFSAASTVDLTIVRVDLNKHFVSDLVPGSRENKRCMSQNACITIVELVHRRPLAVNMSM